MSNRTCFEVNHDQTGMIRRNAEEFADALIAYLNSATAANASRLTQFGFKRLGLRHHSEPFDVKWGCYSASEK